jgi:hypothetical protein
MKKIATFWILILIWYHFKIEKYDFYFNFMMCHWLASQEKFSIECQQVFQTYLNSKTK